jgi:hypothetical protein
MPLCQYVVQENKDEGAMNWLGEIRLGEMQFLHIAKDANHSNIF